MNETHNPTAIHPPGTGLATYAPAPAEQYQAALAMTPEQAKALDEQVRACTRAVLREGTDYGVIPGTSGDQVLFRPGAQKLLQWFGMGFDCQRVEVERDDDGRKHGITYRAVVGKRLPGGSLAVIATCEGTADYDESKFYKSAAQVQADAEAKERMWAKKDKRVANPTKWKDLPEYRAPWNTLMKRAQKRAIVGATIDATAAGGVFRQDQEDDDNAGAGDGDTPSWYEEALETALTFTDLAEGQDLWRESAAAARDGRCTARHATHIQNRIRQRIELLKRTPVVDIDEAAATIAAPDTPAPATTPQDTGKTPKREATPRGTSVLGTISKHLDRLGYPGEDGLRILSAITGHYIGALADLTPAEAKDAEAYLGSPGVRDALEQLLGERKPGYVMTICKLCGAPLIFAITETGASMPLDKQPDLSQTARLAVHHAADGKYYVRTLANGDEPRPGLEKRHMAHFATCPVRNTGQATLPEDSE